MAETASIARASFADIHTTRFLIRRDIGYLPRVRQYMPHGWGLSGDLSRTQPLMAERIDETALPVTSPRHLMVPDAVQAPLRARLTTRGR